MTILPQFRYWDNPPENFNIIFHDKEVELTVGDGEFAVTHRFAKSRLYEMSAFELREIYLKMFEEYRWPYGRMVGDHE